MKVQWSMVLLAAAALCASNNDSPNLKPVQEPMSSLRPLAKFSVPGSPDWIGVGDSIWISNEPKHNLSRLDPGSNEVVATVASGKKPCAGLAMGFDSVWVPNCSDGSVWRLDAETTKVLAKIPTGVANAEGTITAGEGSIWMPANKSGLLARIDPDTNQIVARIKVPAGSYAAMAGEGAIWVTCTKSNLVSRVDPKSEKVVATISVGPSPRFLAAGLGSVWTLNQGDGTVTRIDPATNKVTATIAVGVPGKGGDIDTGEGAVWVSAIGKPISRIDPATNRVTKQFVGKKGGDALRIGQGSLWLANHALHEVWRIDPKGL